MAKVTKRLQLSGDLDLDSCVTKVLYNGLPLELPEWDKEKNPYYIVIKNSYNGQIGVYAKPTPFEVVKTDIAGLEWDDAWVYCFLGDDGSWGNVLEDDGYGSLSLSHLHWTNANIYYAADYPDETLAGTVYLAASDPVKIRMVTLKTSTQQWETLFEGEVTTVESDTYNGSSGQIPTGSTERLFDGDNGIRLTINGASEIYTAFWTSDWKTDATLGNNWLSSGKNSSTQDNGEDYFVRTCLGAFSLGHQLYTRNPGTYQVKIERALFEPTAYLYNDKKLPKLPAFEGYAVIGRSSNYLLRVSALPSYYTGASVVTPAPVQYWKCTDGANWDGPYTVSASDPAFLSNSTYWANHDVIREDDSTVYLAASDPVPVYEEIFETKTLQLFDPLNVAYLYNDMRLPKLPERDKTIYGKAFIKFESLNYIAEGAWSAHVYFCADAKTELYKTLLSSSDYIYATSYIRWTLYDDLSAAFYEDTPNQWINEKVVDQSDFTKLEPLSVIKWSNYDIYHSDGTLFLAASEPVPVYE